MNKILLIFQREYLTRVRKKSFLLTTFLVPIFFIAMYIGVILLTKKSFEDNHAVVYVLDDQGTVGSQLKSNKSLTYILENKKLTDLIQGIKSESENTKILLIPKDFFESKNAEILSVKKSNVQTQSEIQGHLSDILRENEYKKIGVNAETIKQIDARVAIHSKEITDDGGAKDSNTEIAMGIAFGLSILIYLSLFLYGSQVMRGVIEEKSSRIVEVIISSVKPFQLMMGKIIGIGLVGLTQFVLWLILSLALISVASVTLVDQSEITNQISHSNMQTQQRTIDKPVSDNMTADILQRLQETNYVEIIITFFVFFLGGYLIYSALFAAVGSAVDSETEASQFTMPITMPLLLTYTLSFGVLINDPHGSIATWLSFIPFTSPIAMMVRVPFGVPTWQILTSALLLISGFVFTTWIASRIYRIGILMHGKKASYKELIKWIKFKN